MSHGEKLLLVAFILAATGEGSSDVSEAIRMVVACILGVAFANWHTIAKKQEPTP